MPAGAGSLFVSRAVASHHGALRAPHVACDPHPGKRADMPRAVLQPLPPPFLPKRCAPQAQSPGCRGGTEAWRPVRGCGGSASAGAPAASADPCVVPPSRGFLIWGGRKEVSGWEMPGRRGGGSHVAVQREAAPVTTPLLPSPPYVFFSCLPLNEQGWTRKVTTNLCDVCDVCVLLRGCGRERIGVRHRGGKYRGAEQPCHPAPRQPRRSYTHAHSRGGSGFAEGLVRPGDAPLGSGRGHAVSPTGQEEGVRGGRPCLQPPEDSGGERQGFSRDSSFPLPPPASLHLVALRFLGSLVDFLWHFSLLKVYAGLSGLRRTQ